MLASPKLFISQIQVKTKQELLMSRPLLLYQGDPKGLLCIENTLSPYLGMSASISEVEKQLIHTSLLDLSNSKSAFLLNLSAVWLSVILDRQKMSASPADEA